LIRQAIACRPHLGLAGLIALSALTVVFTRSRGVASALASRELIAFASAFTLVGLAMAAYNYQRFGDPFEFGLRYLLAGRNQNRIRLSADNILPGLYYWLACPPAISRIFPWIRPVLRYPFNAPFPPEYFIAVDGGLLALTETGDLVRFDASPDGYKERARASLLTKPTRAAAALANGLLYARDGKTLICVNLK